MPDGLQKFVAETNGLRDHDTAPLLDVNDEPPADVKAHLQKETSCSLK
jgi:hypothetical protein